MSEAPPPRPTARRAWVKVWLALGTLALSGLGAWLTLRKHEEAVASLPDYDRVLSFDPAREGGHLLPNLDLWMQGGNRLGQRIRFVTNSKGFRNEREFPYEVPAGTFRILFSGDSYVDGMRTDQERTIGHLLEAELNRRAEPDCHARFEVLVSGHNNPANAWYHFQEHGQRYHPDLVVLGVTLGNDLTWYSYGTDMLPVTAPDGSVSLRWTGNLDPDGSARPELFLPADSYCDAETLRRRRDPARARPFQSDGAIPFLVPGQNEPRHVHAADFSAALGLYHRPLQPEIERMVSDFEAVAAGFAAAARRGGARFLLVLFPTRVQVYPQEWYQLTQHYALDEERFDLEQPNRRLQASFEGQGVTALDLLPGLRRAAQAEPRCLFRPRGDMHLHERGQEVVANAMAVRVAAIAREECR